MREAPNKTPRQGPFSKRSACECNVGADADSSSTDALERQPCQKAIGGQSQSDGILDVLIDSSKHQGLDSLPREVRPCGATSIHFF